MISKTHGGDATSALHGPTVLQVLLSRPPQKWMKGTLTTDGPD